MSTFSTVSHPRVPPRPHPCCTRCTTATHASPVTPSHRPTVHTHAHGRNHTHAPTGVGMPSTTYNVKRGSMRGQHTAGEIAPVVDEGENLHLDLVPQSHCPYTPQATQTGTTQRGIATQHRPSRTCSGSPSHAGMLRCTSRTWMRNASARVKRPGHSVHWKKSLPVGAPSPPLPARRRRASWAVPRGGTLFPRDTCTARTPRAAAPPPRATPSDTLRNEGVDDVARRNALPGRRRGGCTWLALRGTAPGPGGVPAPSQSPSSKAGGPLGAVVTREGACRGELFAETAADGAIDDGALPS